MKEDGSERPKVFAELHKDERKLVIYFRKDFGDGKDFNGLPIADDSVSELDELHDVLNEAAEILADRQKSVMPIERWSHVSMIETMKEQQ